MKIADLRKKKADELKKMVLDLKKESFNLRFQRVSNQLTSTSRVKEVRRTIARIKTLLNADASVESK
ncbi:50S ribosomal protein L29 [Alphaproteobacteria bacterium]|nr:50S ribosomal protein L29 [Alphaproteobacteria bacterium]